MDLTVPWLPERMPLDVAARLLLAICLLTTLAGVAWLHRVLINRWSLYSLLATLFAYHGSLMARMVSLSLGIGLVPAATALWIRIEDAKVMWRLLAGSLIAFVLYICRLVAVGGFGLLIAGCALARICDDRRRAVSELTLVAASGLLLLLLFAQRLFGDEHGASSAGIVYGNLAWKLKALLAPLANYNLTLDIVSFALIAGLFLAAWWTSRLMIDRRVAPGLALLALAFILAPKALWAGGAFDSAPRRPARSDAGRLHPYRASIQPARPCPASWFGPAVPGADLRFDRGLV